MTLYPDEQQVQQLKRIADALEQIAEHMMPREIGQQEVVFEGVGTPSPERLEDIKAEIAARASRQNRR